MSQQLDSAENPGIPLGRCDKLPPIRSPTIKPGHQTTESMEYANPTSQYDDFPSLMLTCGATFGLIGFIRYVPNDALNGPT